MSQRDSKDDRDRTRIRDACSANDLRPPIWCLRVMRQTVPALVGLCASPPALPVGLVVEDKSLRKLEAGISPSDSIGACATCMLLRGPADS